MKIYLQEIIIGISEKIEVKVIQLSTTAISLLNSLMSTIEAELSINLQQYFDIPFFEYNYKGIILFG